ncbi:MAG TPA: biotin/lipoyl-containing protein, partial [Candidatus Baltobacteraceae bacterium]|nr:biotin/lipoyl-containing protein [Candidatus Baltobacteraceae bacterium]
MTLPEMGESVTEGSIVEWRKKVGDFVAEGDPLVDVTTDKVDVEVPATASGVITQILAGEGETVAVGSALAEIDTAKGNGKPSAPTGAPQRLGPPQLIDVILPEMGESVTEGSIVEVRKKPGDYVAEGETLVEVTTDKVDVEVPAPAAGAIVQVFVAAGDTVAVGAKLAELDVNAAPVSGAATAAPAPA